MKGRHDLTPMNEGVLWSTDDVVRLVVSLPDGEGDGDVAGLVVLTCAVTAVETISSDATAIKIFLIK